MLSDIFKKNVDEDEDEHGLNEAGAGLAGRVRGGQDQILRWLERMIFGAGLDHSPDEARHYLHQLL